MRTIRYLGAVAFYVGVIAAVWIVPLQGGQCLGAGPCHY